jgi:hypothetical protein
MGCCLSINMVLWIPDKKITGIKRGTLETMIRIHMMGERKEVVLMFLEEKKGRDEK